MDFTPLLNAPLPVKIHVATVVPAALIGAVQLVRKKGTPSHKALGYIFVVLMLITAVDAFFVRGLNRTGGLSLVHLFIPLTFIGVASGLYQIRRGNVRGHLFAMTSLYVGAVLIAGYFAFAPGRIMHDMFFGH